jgi:hypothetical protein
MVDSSSLDGALFSQWYHCSQSPFVAVIDPTTLKIIKQWSSLDARTAVDRLQYIVDSFTFEATIEEKQEPQAIDSQQDHDPENTPKDRKSEQIEQSSTVDENLLESAPIERCLEALEQMKECIRGTRNTDEIFKYVVHIVQDMKLLLDRYDSDNTKVREKLNILSTNASLTAEKVSEILCEVQEQLALRVGEVQTYSTMNVFPAE